MVAQSETEFRVGTAFSRTFSLFFGNFLIFGAIPMLVGMPLALSEAINNSPGQVSLATVGTMAFMALASMIFSIFLWIALTHAALQKLQGEDISLTTSLWASVRLFFPFLAVTILMVLTISAGMVLLIIPGLILAAMLYVAGPALVAERRGVFPSLSRSFELTKGRRWSIFGLVVLVFVGLFLMQLLILSVSSAFLLSQGTEGTIGFSTNQIVIVTVMGMIMSGLQTGFVTIMPAVTYHQLRAEKEGLDPGTISRVFE